MEQVLRQGVGVLRGMWQRRWIGLAVAWIVAVVGAVALWRVPDRFEAGARIYVDTQTVLKPLMSGLAVQPDVDMQVLMLARTLITRPNIEKLMRSSDLDLQARTPEERDRMVDKLIKDIKLVGSGRENLYDISFRDTDQERAKRVVQSLVSMFVESGLGDKRRDSETARKFIDEQIKSYERKLQEAENRVKEFRLRNFGFTGGAGQDYFGRLNSTSEELAKVTTELRSAEQSRDALRRELQGEEPVFLPDDRGSANGASVVPELDARIDQQKKLLDDLLRRYTDQHPDVVATQRLIKQLEGEKSGEIDARRKAAATRQATNAKPTTATNPVYQQLRVSLAEQEARVAALRGQAADINGRLDTLRASAGKVPQVEAELAQMNRDYEVLKRNYDQLVSRRESASLSEGVDATAGLADFRVIDPPRVSPQAVFPNRLMLVPLVLLAAVAAGVFATFVLSQLSPTVQDTATLRAMAGRPVLGSVTRLPNALAVRQQRTANYGFAAGLASLVALYAGWILFLAVNSRV